MQRIILDTNVLVSALISPGLPADIVEQLVLDRQVKLCLSEEILEEYADVLNRKKFSRFPDFQRKAIFIINFFREIADLYRPKQKVELIRDKSDNKFLELAIAAKAHFLITGNTNDFTMDKIALTSIVSPRAYWDLHKPGL